MSSQPDKPPIDHGMRGVDKGYLITAALLFLLFALPVFAGFAGLAWELSQLAGLLACVVCIVLVGAPVRPRDTQPPTLITLPRHSFLGWAALAFVLLHVCGSVISEPAVIEYLKPSMPLYQLVGMVSLIILLVLVVGSGRHVRRLWRSHRGFQATHVILACGLIVTLGLHIIATNRYTGGPVRRALLLLAMLAALLMLLRSRRKRQTVAAETQPRLVFGRHGTLIACSVIVTVMSLTVLYAAAANSALREPLTPSSHQLPLDFPHGKHVQVNCLLCHHNFADNRGFDRCVACHESNRTDLIIGVEARFHMFCFECHRHPDAALDKHGPVSGCGTCHRKPS
jgi:DMSO/TMAO reductase YedYZ heme-binding membrane subunit